MISAPPRPITRRRALAALAGAGGVALLGACGRDGQDGGEQPAAGSTAPARVAAIGQGTDADTLLALGITPVGISASSFTPSGILPWTQAALGDTKVETFPQDDGLPIEAIAATRPDLIVATTHWNFAQDRALLEQVAPTIGPTTTADQETWQQSTTRVGEAVGRADDARALVRDTEDRLTAIRDAHPAWAGKTFTFGPALGGELYTVLTRDNVSAVLLEQLGLALSPRVQTLPESSTPGRAQVSMEQVSVLDADAMLLTYFADDVRTATESHPLFQRVPAVRRGSYIAVNSDVALGMAFPSVLSIPYAMDRIVPELERALAAR